MKLLKSIKVYLIPIIVKGVYLFFILASILFFKNYFQGKLFNFFIEVTSVAAIGQQFFRFGSNYKLFKLENKNQLFEAQKQTIVRIIFFGIIIFCINFYFIQGRSQLNFLIGLIIGGAQVLLANRYSFATQKYGYVKSAMIDPTLIQMLFASLLSLVGFNLFSLLFFEYFIIAMFLAFILYNLLQNKLYKVKNVLKIEKNELWSFATNLSTIGGSMLALYLLSSSSTVDSNSLFDLKILERSIAIGLLLPSILNPYFYNRKQNLIVFSNRITLILSFLACIGLFCFLYYINFHIANNYWLLLLLLFVLIAPNGSYYGFILCLNGKSKIIFITTFLGLITQWSIFFIFTSSNAILYGVTLNYVVQYLCPIFIYKKIANEIII